MTSPLWPHGRTQGALLFGEFWLTLVIGLLLLGVILRQWPLVASAAALFLTGAVGRLWARYALDRVYYERRLSTQRAFLGEKVSLTLRVANRKLLPLPWLEVLDEFPQELCPAGEKLSPTGWPNKGFLSRVTSLVWFERVSWHLELDCRRRGYYLLGPARLKSGDVFGLYPQERRDRQTDFLLVYPRVLPLAEIGLPSHKPFGDVKGGERIFEDPSRTLGLRDYHPEDPLKRVDWKATARRQQLQVRIYEPTVAHHLLVAVNADTLGSTWKGYSPEMLEEAVTVAASVASWADERRQGVGLLANGSYPGSERPIKVPVGRSPEHLRRVLEGLAVLTPFVTGDMAALLRDEARGLPLGSTVVLVSAYVDDSLADVMSRLSAAGYRTAVISVGEEPPAVPPGVIWYQARRLLPAEEAFDR